MSHEGSRATVSNRRTKERNGGLATTNKVHFTSTIAERYRVAVAVHCASFLARYRSYGTSRIESKTNTRNARVTIETVSRKYTSDINHNPSYCGSQ